MTGERDPRRYVLARDLGMTVAELDQRMGAGEYIEWLAFYKYDNEMRRFYGGG